MVAFCQFVLSKKEWNEMETIDKSDYSLTGSKHCQQAIERTQPQSTVENNL